MNKDDLNAFRDLYDVYQRAMLISHGSPDQFQYRQNQLTQAVAEFLLAPYLKYEEEEKKKRLEAMNFE